MLQLSTEKILNKQQSCESSTPEEKPFLKRNVHIGWRHRENFQSDYKNMGSVIGPMVKIVLNASEDFTVEELKQVMMMEYFNGKNKYFFDNSLVCIGTYDDISIQKFVNSDKEDGSFWEYSRLLKKKSHYLKIYLLTTFLDLDKYNGKDDKKKDSYLSSYHENEKIDKEKLTKESSYKDILKDINIEQLYNTKMEKNDNLKGTVSNDKSLRYLDEAIDLTDLDNYSQSPSFSLLRKNKANPSMENEKFIPSPPFSLLTKNKENPSMENEKSIPSPPFSLITSLKINNLPFHKQKDLDNDRKQDSDDLLFKKPLVVTKENQIDNLKLSIPVVDEKDITFSNEVIEEGGQGIVIKGKFLGTDVAIKSYKKVNTTRHF